MIFKGILGDGYGPEKDIALAFGSLSKILDGLKTNRIHEPNDATVRIFADLTKNHSITGTFYGNENVIFEKYKEELQIFMYTKILRVIQATIEMIPKEARDFTMTYLSDDIRTEFDSLYGFDNKVSPWNVLELKNNDLNDSELKLRRILNQFDDGDGSQNVLGILYLLLRNFEEVNYSVKYGAGQSKLTGEYDRRMLLDIGIKLGYMITLILVSLTKDHPDFQNDSEIGNDYMKYSTQGNFTVPNMLCCFKNEKSLSLAIDDRSAKLDTLTKDMLRNMLVVSNLT